MGPGPIGERQIIREERAASHKAQPINSDARRRERRFALPRAHRRLPLFLFGRAGWEAITLRVSWVDGRSPQAPLTCGRAAGMQLARSRAYPSFICSSAPFGRLLVNRAGRKIGIAATMITFEAPPPGYDVLWCVGVGAAIASVTSR